MKMKKMKLKKSKSSPNKAVLFAILGVVLVAAIVLLAIFLINRNKEDPIVMQGINVASYPTKSQYYIGEEFDPNGIKIQVLMSEQSATYFVVDHSKLTFSGFDSSKVNDAVVITVTYEGYSTTFTVKVKEHESATPTLVSIEAKDIKTSYSMDYWNEFGPDYNNAYLLCTYSDGSTENVWIQNTWATQREIMKAPGKSYVTIEYMGQSIVVEFTITK